MNDVIKNIYAPILCTNQKRIKITDFLLFADYVRGVYKDVLRKEYSDDTSEPTEALNDDSSDDTLKPTEILNVDSSEFDNLMLEMIFSNLYEYLTLILQSLENKGMRHESYLMSLKLSDNEYKKYSGRFRKRMQPDRIQIKGISSFKHVYSHNYNMEGISEIKYYIPRLLKAYRDVILIPRKGTSIIDISKYYYDIFTALMYEEESNLCNKEYTNNKELIKSYQVWDFSNGTISQIEDMYKLITKQNDAENSDKNNGVNSDKLSEILFVEKLFGLITISELLNKECEEKEYIKFAHSISLMNCLGYSRLHKTIIQKITWETADVYERMIDEYIYPVCTKCMIECINEIIYYIDRFETEKRIAVVKKFRNACREKMQRSPLLSEGISYNLINRIKKIKRERIKDLDCNAAVELVKELKYSRINKDSETEKEFAIKSLMRDYALDYDIDINNVEVYDCGVIELTFAECDNDDMQEYIIDAESGIDKETGRIKW